MITYVFEFVGQPHVSLILINTFVVHCHGVNVNDNPFALSVHVLHPFVEYATAILGDGVAVSLILHVVLDDEFVRVPFAYTVHVSVGAVGAAISIVTVLHVVVEYHGVFNTYHVYLYVPLVSHD